MQTKPTPAEGNDSAKLEVESALLGAACSDLWIINACGLSRPETHSIVALSAAYRQLPVSLRPRAIVIVGNPDDRARCFRAIDLFAVEGVPAAFSILNCDIKRNGMLESALMADEAVPHLHDVVNSANIYLRINRSGETVGVNRVSDAEPNRGRVSGDLVEGVFFASDVESDAVSGDIIGAHGGVGNSSPNVQAQLPPRSGSNSKQDASGG